MSVEISREVVAEAKQGGWVPREEFRGEEADWVDADVFVKRGREINPILRKQNAELKRKVEEAQRDAREAIESAKEFKKFQKEQFAREKSALESEIAALRESKKRAISEGDGELAVELDERIEGLREAKAELREPETQQAPAPDPVLQDWLERNDWFGADRVRTRRANEIGYGLRMEFPNLHGAAFLEKFDEALDAEAPKRERGSSNVEGATGRPSKGGKKSFSDLPPEAQAVCDRQVKQGLWKNREEYIAMYDWE